jgi:hypothetical protein
MHEKAINRLGLVSLSINSAQEGIGFVSLLVLLLGDGTIWDWNWEVTRIRRLIPSGRLSEGQIWFLTGCAAPVTTICPRSQAPLLA